MTILIGPQHPPVMIRTRTQILTHRGRITHPSPLSQKMMISGATPLQVILTAVMKKILQVAGVTFLLLDQGSTSNAPQTAGVTSTKQQGAHALSIIIYTFYFVFLIDHPTMYHLVGDNVNKTAVYGISS